MKVRVAYTVDVPEHWRRAIRQYYGKSGLATRDEIVDWLKTYGSSMDDDLGLMGQGIVDHCLETNRDGSTWHLRCDCGWTATAHALSEAEDLIDEHVPDLSEGP